MTVFFDTNVLIDIANHRQPFLDDSDKSLQLAHRFHKPVTALSAFATLAYYHERFLKSSSNFKRSTLVNTMRDFQSILEVLPAGNLHIERACASPVSDFEDALLDEIAYAGHCHLIVTRNIRDFKKSKTKAITPIDFLLQYA